MRKLIIILSLSLISYKVSAQQSPKIVVGIVVDQMKYNYLNRFYSKFEEGGFKRLKNEGFDFRNAHYNYVPTYTAPGHASIYTGTTPANHSIIANDWYDKKSGLKVYCVSDLTETAVGGTAKYGKISPRNLKASTVTDELRIASNFRSKVVGISIKDRGAVLPAGHNPTGAYWFDSKTGNFMSSTYYFKELPKWVQNFNKKKLTNKYLKQDWNTLRPIETYTESSADNSIRYEKSFKGQETPTFPYKLSELVKKNGIGIIRTTPFGNSIVADMAIAAIDGEDLGKDDITDFLAVSFSATDYIGHAFGPNSIEIEDTYLRMDLEIKRILQTLDKKFGNDYVVFLTADHGVVNNPSFLKDNKMIGGYINAKATPEKIKEALNQKIGAGEWVKNISNDQIFLDRKLIEDRKLNLKEVQDILCEIVMDFDAVYEAYPAYDMAKRAATGNIKHLFENGYNKKKSGDVLIRLKAGYLQDNYGTQGTSHGTSYTYDTHVPILFYGKSIPKGRSIRKVEIVDIAPTLSLLLKIPFTNSATGLPLTELFSK